MAQDRDAWKMTMVPMRAIVSCRHWHTTKCGAGRICGADLNGDNLRISTAYLRISDHCRVRIRVWVRVRVRVRIKVRVRFSVANCIQTAGEGDKMRINHVIKIDQWRCAPQICPAPHFVVSRRHGNPSNFRPISQFALPRLASPLV